MTPILVLTAVELEARVLARLLELPLLESFPFLAFGHERVRVAPVGLRAASCGPRWNALLNGLRDPLIISGGVCGALDPRLAHGDVVIPERVIDTSGRSFPIAATAHGDAVAGAGPRVCTGLLVTTADVVATPMAKAALFASTGASAVDMESALIVARAAASDRPALVVRAVSDDARQTLPAELAGLLTPEGRMKVSRALAMTLTRPSTLTGAIDLGRRTRQALRAVARVLAGLVA